MPEHDRTFDPHYGEAVEVAPGVRRLTARNPGPFTFHGTNTFLVGSGPVAVIDPGPDDPAHVAAILAAAGPAGVSHILVTHTHLDHSPAARALAAATGAPVYGEGPHRPARAPRPGRTLGLDASGDLAFRPDVVLRDGDRVAGDGWAIEAVATPGHAANHLAFALGGTDILFSGDHVMAWSTTIVAPPDGAMADYLASLDRLLARPESVYLPAHGGPQREAHAYVAALKAHRAAREAAVLARLGAGDRTLADLVDAIYAGLDPALKPAAALSVLAHLDHLVERGLVGEDHPALATGGTATESPQE
ncbi:MBL fold metallo-hydrolase [Segnochrobactrum spirostomi]|uniref:MBL fold metallo-hydrolase n=1 Tax=Segnochrobactrum spirostomi TaxID=2608987 RepID=A0A6A7XXY9_9HYPH|nr:MBL fold metallo-hydrolase [Segnochrobactrum spirostomi]MQT11564.1 MBL fold metallo-hydrolase [Segnochrobactrum spirostomi]